MKDKYTFLSPMAIKTHLIDVNLLLDYLITASGESGTFNEQEVESFQLVLSEIQSHVNAMFPDVETLEKRLNTAVSSLSSVN